MSDLVNALAAALLKVTRPAFDQEPLEDSERDSVWQEAMDRARAFLAMFHAAHDWANNDMQPAPEPAPDSSPEPAPAEPPVEDMQTVGRADSGSIDSAGEPAAADNLEHHDEG
jgi:hypothetical protein